jgi:ribosome-associated protein
MTEDSKPTESEESAPAYSIPDDSSGWNLAERAGWHLLDLQGENVLILDLRGLSDVCDFFVLATGTSDVHVRALSRHLQDQLLDVNEKARGVEGMGDGRWALLDFFDVIVHVFKADVREYFQLEKLWSDAKTQEIAPEWFANEEVKGRHPGLFPVDPGSGG